MPSSPQSSLVMAKTNSALDVPEEPDVEVAEEEPPTSTLSFFTAVRYTDYPSYPSMCRPSLPFLQDCKVDGKGLWVCC